MSDFDLRLGDCREILPMIESGTVDAVISDPPYACVDRPYGRLSEREWHALMDVVVPECRRILKPSGSAVFVLQPNSERVGRMRSWLWEFLAKWAREWNQVQDVWWWNYATLPAGGATMGGLTRSSLKVCAWFGRPDCYRNQDAVLWGEAERSAVLRVSARSGLNGRPSGQTVDDSRAYAAAVERGGVTPFNLLPIPNTTSASSASANGHGAGTPHDLADWWCRYIAPKGGIVCDPFAGVGTIPIAALERKRRVIAIEQRPEYFETMKRRIERPHLRVAPVRARDGRPTPLFDDLGEDEP